MKFLPFLIILVTSSAFSQNLEETVRRVLPVLESTAQTVLENIV